MKNKPCNNLERKKLKNIESLSTVNKTLKKHQNDNDYLKQALNKDKK